MTAYFWAAAAYGITCVGGVAYYVSEYVGVLIK